VNLNDPNLGSSPTPDAGMTPEGGSGDPISVGEFGGDGGIDAFTSDAPKIKFGSLLIVIVVLIAGGAVFGMRTLSKITAATRGSSDVERTVEHFLKSGVASGSQSDNPLGLGDDSVLGVLDGDYTERQIPLQDVQKNPFAPDGTLPGGNAHVDTGAGSGSWNRIVQSAAAKLELKSVMGGQGSRNPLANINGRIVSLRGSLTVGGVTFRVTKIRTDAVVLVAKDPQSDAEVETTVFLKRDR
jgi:hypothetical protein